MNNVESPIITYGTTPGTSVNPGKLYQYTTPKHLTVVNGFGWHLVKELHILKFRSRGPVENGCYVNSTNTWVLLVGATKNQIRNAINQCGPALKTLDLRYPEFGELDVSRLTNLETLCLSGTKFRSPEEGEFPVRGLSGLSRLVSLDLSFTACKMLPELPTGLRQLDLSGNPGLTEVKKLPAMHELEELNLSCTDIEYLDLSGQTKLRQLRLVDTAKLTAISGIDKNPNMEVLDLSCSKIARLPDGIGALDKLIRLDLSHLVLDGLPNGVSLRELVSVERKTILHGTSIQGVEMKSFDRRRMEAVSREEILDFAEEFDQNKKMPIGEAKVVFLGDGGAGKTRTIARLLTDGGEPEGYTEETTPGVKISPKRYDNIGGQEIDVRFWDFGGQEHIFPVHYPFMEGASLYVVVLDAKKGDPEKQAGFWLEVIGQLKDGADRPVLLVLNKVDNEEDNYGINEPELRERYHNIFRVIKMSAMRNDRETFDRKLIQRMKTVLGSNKIPAQDLVDRSWHKLRNKIGKEAEPKISREAFEQYAEESGVKAGEYEKVLSLFGNMGICYTCTGNGALGRYVILNPNWLTNALYTIAFNRTALEEKYPQTKDGIITHDQIRWILDPDNAGENRISRVWPEIRYEEDEIQYILELMRAYKLSVEREVGVELIPLLCNADTPKKVMQAERSRDMICYILRYQSLMPDVIHRLMLRHHAQLHRAWKAGAELVRKEDGAEAIVRIPLRDDNSTENYIQIFAKIQYDQVDGGQYGDDLLDELIQIGNELHLEPDSKSVIVDARSVSNPDAPMVKEELDLEEFEYRLNSGDDTIYSKKLKCPVKIMDIRFAARQEIAEDPESII